MIRLGYDNVEILPRAALLVFPRKSISGVPSIPSNNSIFSSKEEP